MNRLTSGTVSLFALLLVAGCGSEPTGNLRGGVQALEAAPSQIFLELGESKTVDVRAVDEQGNRISSSFEVTSTGPGITVKRDSTYLPVYVDDTTLTVPPEAPVFRFVVTATGYGTTSFTVTSAGHDVNIPVQVVAQSVIQAQISNLTPALAEVVTITAPAGVSFSPTSIVTFEGATSQPVEVTVAADGKSISFLPPPNIANAQATISDVVSDATPSLIFSPVTADRITTPAIPSWPGTYSNLTPAANEEVTVTLTGATFDPATTLILGAVPPVVTDLSGNTLKFVPAPGTIGQLTINGVVLDALPQFSLSLPAAEADTLTVGSTVAAIAGTGTTATAPTLGTPGTFATTLYDASTFTGADITGDGGVGAQYYKLTVATTDTLTISASSDNGGPDIDLVVCGDAACNTAPLVAASAAHDESGTAEFLPGTYYIAVVNFDGAASTFINVTAAPGTLE